MIVYYDSDWVYCKDCLWHELGDCDGPESDEYGCYRGEKMEDEYIERERYYKYSMLYDLAYHDDVNGNCDGKIDITVVDCISGADVKPVRHGEWLKQEQEYPMMGCKVIVGYKCSVCGGKQELKTNYCCDCGATMDGGNE